MTRRPIARVVVKIGTTSIVGSDSRPDLSRLAPIVEQVALLKKRKVSCVIVSSGAIAAGMAPLGLTKRPSDMPTLQAAAAVGQRSLMDIYAQLFQPHGIPVGQVLLTQQDIVQRRHYLNARNTLMRLIELNAVPIVNENDTVAVEEIRYGDNDRLAALVANLVSADLLVMLSDVEGLYSSKPSDPSAELIPVVDAVSDKLISSTRGSSSLGSGGMSSKLEAARMASLSGVPAVIASAARNDVLIDIQMGKQIGTYFPARASKVQARKLWIAWAPASRGRLVVDEGAASAITDGKKSLLAAGIRSVEGSFKAGDAVEVVSATGGLIAKGLVTYDADVVSAMAGKRGEIINRDSLVVL